MRIRSTLLVAALLWPLAGQAQEAPAVSAAKDYFQSSARASAADLADLSVVDSYLDRRTGATHVYLAQRVNGVEVYGSVSAAAVTDAGRVLVSGDAFQADLAARANDAAPALPALAAVAAAEARALALTPGLAEFAARPVADDPTYDAMPAVTYRTIGEPALVYEAVPGGALRLAWAVELAGDGGPTGQQLWMIRVDAHTGTVLAADDLVAYDHFGDAPARTDFAPLAAPTALPLMAAASAGTYTVVPLPFESPNHGSFQAVSNPDNADASPFGWHDLNGAAGNETTNSTGANVFAFTDFVGLPNQPDPGSAAEGGAGLVFNAVYDPSLAPQESTEAAVTSLFYWNNVIHDVLWQYGFDEASGNFQSHNYGRGGSANDPVNADALDGSGTNNANFSTPSDGQRPRMQMFEWTGVPIVSATAPASIAGTYPAAGAVFGASTPETFAGEVASATDPEGTNDFSCESVEGVSGKIALAQRGDCAFVVKARNAQLAGAIGILVYNCQPGVTGCSETDDADNVVTMGGDDFDDIVIPAAFVGRTSGLTFRDNIPDTAVTIQIPQSRDSDYDAGVIAHEYGHGVSNRLTGGRFATGCLSNDEQMGEGWSDYIGAMLTMQATDTGAQARGIGTYLTFEPLDGEGIRPTPYSTDFAVNPTTYQTVIDEAGGALSVPHGVGYAWATMIWDMTWALIDQDGFGDIYDADGGFGNQKALQLVIEGMKLQPCSPGFVDGRDAIFEADQLLYGGAHQQLIGNAFATRGLGLNADQGESTDPNDGTADFTPFPVASETDANGQTTSLVVSGANPFRTATALTLNVASAQDVTVDVVDLLGRRVATLFDGEMAAGTDRVFTLDADALPSGVYLVRASGETFSLTERVTVAR